MGIKSVWQNSVSAALKEIGVTVVPVEHDRYELLRCNEKLIINLVSLDNNYDAAELIELQSVYKHEFVSLVQLWEDVWLTRKAQVLGRIKSVLGLNQRLHARKAKIITIDQKQADDFLSEHHIQSSARAKYKFALKIDDQIVAVACFSNIRLMKRIAAGYRSVELIRFATLMGFTITGGFSKLISHFMKLVKPNDIMSYADRDWSLGNAYEQSGFKLSGITSPAIIWLRKEDLIRFFPHRLPVSIPQHLNQLHPDFEMENSISNEFMTVFNTGNLKYILFLNDGF